MISRSIIEQLREFDTAIVSNTIAFLDPTPADQWYMGRSIRSLTPTLGPTVGVAMTCEMDSSTPGGTANIDGFWKQLEAMQAMNLPSVWIVKAVGSRPEHECIFGDGMAKMLHACGCGGVVTDGGVRDVPGLMTIPFAAYALGTTAHHCALRIRAIDIPVEIGGITVQPGDLVHANAEGVIKVPPGCIDALPERTAAMRQAEQEVHKLWRRTDLPVAQMRTTVAEIFPKFGFHLPR